MESKKIFVTYHCKVKSPLLEQSLKEKKYIVENKNCEGVQILRYIFREKPAICIIKSFHKEISGLEIVKEAFFKDSKTKFIIVFEEVSEIDIALAKRFNISGCIKTSDSIEEALNCLEQVHNNNQYFSNTILEEIDTEILNNYLDFTNFQKKIISYIGFYNTPQTLAKKLNVAISTVNLEINLIKKKLALKEDQPLHLWAAYNTTFIETLMLNQAS